MLNIFKSKDEHLDTLNEIVSTHKDAADFYHSASEKAKDQELSSMFTQLGNTHQGALYRIEALIKKKDETRTQEDIKGTIAGTSNQWAGELMALVSSDPDGKLIDRLEEAEERCRRALEEASEMEIFTAAERRVLLEELLQVKNSHSNVKYLKAKRAA